MHYLFIVCFTYMFALEELFLISLYMCIVTIKDILFYSNNSTITQPDADILYYILYVLYFGTNTHPRLYMQTESIIKVLKIISQSKKSVK